MMNIRRKTCTAGTETHRLEVPGAHARFTVLHHEDFLGGQRGQRRPITHHRPRDLRRVATHQLDRKEVISRPAGPAAVAAIVHLHPLEIASVVLPPLVPLSAALAPAASRRATAPLLLDQAAGLLPRDRRVERKLDLPCHDQSTMSQAKRSRAGNTRQRHCLSHGGCGNTRQRHCLGHEDSGNTQGKGTVLATKIVERHKAKALS